MDDLVGGVWESNGTSGLDRIVLILEESESYPGDVTVRVAYLYHAVEEFTGRVYVYPLPHLLKRFRKLV